MTSERHARAKQIFLRACELEHAQRAAYLDEACSGDAALRTAVVELLANDDEPHALLAAADAGGAARWLAWGLSGEAQLGEALPERIGAYRIVSLLGRGGMGAVYLAEQEHPRRRVALKVSSVGLGSPDHARRFDREAHILGRLHHPGIAQVYGAGTAEIFGALRPYFVMELVEGATLLEHARRAGLGTIARLELLVQVCDAVQHAHENGILHRDLKASNVVVDAAGRAKVLDFGVARLLESEGAEPSSATASGVVVGTLATMSPEQVSGSSRLDERSDVYSLGVMAYEMLSGHPPLDVATLALPQAARRICEEDPPLAGTYDRALRGDLETILAKALSKDRERRYASARDLAADFRRFSRSEPIEARPASTFYHLRMFARRNRALAAGLVIAALTLLVGSLAVGWFAMGQRDLRMLADSNRSAAERETYRANVISAALALENGNPAQARELLSASASRAPTWEWRRVHRDLEQWTAVFDLEQRIAQSGLIEGGRALVAIGHDGSTRIWRVETGMVESELAADPERSSPLALSADGATCASQPSHELVLWDTRTGEERSRRPAPAGARHDPRGLACFSPDGRWLGVAGQLFDLSVPASPPRAIPEGQIAFDGPGHLLAVAGPAAITVQDAATGRELHRFPCAERIRAVALDARGQWLCASDRQRVHLFDLSSGRARVLDGAHSDPPTALAFRPDGAQLAAMQDDGSIWIRDVAEGVVVRRLWVGRASWKTSLAWSDDGTELFSAAWTTGLVRRWDARGDPEALRGHASYVYPVAYTPDGRRIVSGSWDRTVRVWSAATGGLLATLRAHTGRIQCLAVSPDGMQLASGSDDGTLILWDACTGALRARLEAGGTWTALAWSPDGLRLAAAESTEKGAVRILDARRLAVLAEIAAHSGSVHALAFAPDGGTLASGGADGKVFLWDWGAGRERARLDGLPPVNALAFSASGRELAVAADGGRLLVLDGRNLERRRTLAGHQGEVFGAAFSPDGARLFSGGRDGELRVWDVASGTSVGQFPGHSDYIWSVAVHPDGTRVATGSGDGTVRQWESDPAPVTYARRREAEERAREAGPLVARILAAAGDATVAAERLREDPELSEELRGAALDELLRRASQER